MMQDLFTIERLDTAAMVKSGNLQMPIYNLSEVNADTICPVLNMLNTRWVIYGNENTQYPYENTTAYGNAWFVDSLKIVDNANQELDALKTVSPRRFAIVDKQFAQVLGGNTLPADSADYVKLTNISSTNVEYEASSKKGGVAVFSEIYYPGWEATIDGKPADLARANYVLRAMNIPAGKHKIEMNFNPQSVKTTETIAYVCLAILLLAIVLAAFLLWKKSRTNETPQTDDNTKVK
jgi:uncharacterized membrane protein YfhO